jgi:hypothetical protein
MGMSVGTCAGCGTSVAPAASFMTEVGEICGQCFARYQNEQAARARAATTLDQSLFRRAKMIGGLHGMVWAAAFILAAEAMPLSSEIGTALVAAAFVLTIGLVMRRRWAFIAALALDGPGTVVFMILPALTFKPGRGWLGFLIPPFTLVSGALLWVLRAAYSAERPGLDVSVHDDQDRV